MDLNRAILLPLALLAGCAAARPEPATSLPRPPSAPETRAPDPPVWSDPSRQPSLWARAPDGWQEAYSKETRGRIVFVHDSGSAMIEIELLLTEERALGDIAEDMCVAMGADASPSMISVSASGDAAWFAWARHPSPRRTNGSHGKVRLIRFPTMPERMAVVSGIWPYGRGSEFSAAFDRIAEGVQLR